MEPGKSDMKKSTTLTCIFFMNGFMAGIARQSATSANNLLYSNIGKLLCY